MADNHFASTWALGYHRLVPIVPPDAHISDKSSMAKRKDARGKAVGIKGNNGWYGFDWVKYTSDEHDTQRWFAMGAGVGIKTGEGLIAIDADTLNLDHARIIKAKVEEHFGTALPVRIGNNPKALYLARVTDTYKYTRIEFGKRKPDNTLEDRVEILSDGRQFVAYGIHPKTEQPYVWPRPLIHYDDLPLLEPGQLDAFLKDCAAILPAASELIREGGTAKVDQSSLRGDTKTIRKAIAALPNTSEHFPSREAYRDIGYALKAAVAEDEALDLFQEWAAKWEDGHNDPDIVKADFARMKPPFRIGAPFIYDKADALSAGKFSIAEAYFEPIFDSPFVDMDSPPPGTDIYPVLTVSDLMSRPPPEWLIDRYFPKKSVGFVYSKPGAGKTFIVLDAAMSIAAQLPDWHGDKIAPSGQGQVVLYLAAEGSYGFRNRVKAWLKARDLGADKLTSFRLIETSINFMSQDDIDRLVRTIKAVVERAGHSLALVVVDTVSRSMPGADENLQKDMTVFVRACDAVKDRFGCAVIGVHHAGKNGDMRGSTVLLGAGDFVFALDRKKGVMTGVLACEKMKDGPDGWEDQYRFETVALDADETSLAVCRADSAFGPQREVTPELARDVLRAMASAWDEGEPWSKAVQSKERYCVRRMVADFGFDAALAEITLKNWEDVGLIMVETRSPKHHKVGLKVCLGLGQTVHNDGIFG